MYNRKNLKYITEDDLYFSLLRGSGVYCWNNITDNDPVDVSGRTSCPVFMDVETEELFLVQRVYWDKYIRQYEQGIYARPDLEHVIWPVDLVSLHGHELTVNYVEHTFGLPTDEIKNHTAGDTVLLFPYKNYGIAKTAADELKEVKKISWKEPRIRELLVRIPEAFQKLNEAGYLNMDFDFSHLYLRDDKSIMFEYTNLMMPLNATPAQGREALCKGEYPYEFAEPALVQGTLRLPDLNMQNYSLTAMLFYLMIGRMPYDGPLLLGLTDNNEVEHEHRYEVYHKTPVFIFDPQDSSNHLGEFAADQKVIDLWEELPEQIRELFTQTLTQQNALRKREVSNPSPAQWLECLQLL